MFTKTLANWAQAFRPGENQFERGRVRRVRNRSLFVETLEPRCLLSGNSAPVAQDPDGLLLLDEGDPQPDPIPLTYDPDVPEKGGVFFDPDRGDSLTFTIEENTNPDLVSARVVDGQLQVTYADYFYQQDRTPAQITIRATDLSGASAEFIQHVVVLPDKTIDVQLVAREHPTPHGEFTFFTSHPSPADRDASGVFRARLQGDSLTYELRSLGFRNENGIHVPYDLDGTFSPRDPSDDVTGISFRDASQGDLPVFDLLADDDLVISGRLNRTIHGMWEAGPEGLGNFLTPLYRGDLYIWVTTNGNPEGEKITRTHIRPTPELVELPSSESFSVEVGQTYVVEVWVKDTYAQSTGMSSIFVDLYFDPHLSSGAAVVVADSFEFFRDAQMDNEAGRALMGGATLFSGVGRDPSYARVGYVVFSAVDAGLQSLNLDVLFVHRRAGPEIHASQVDSGQVTVWHRPLVADGMDPPGDDPADPGSADQGSSSAPTGDETGSIQQPGGNPGDDRANNDSSGSSGDDDAVTASGDDSLPRIPLDDALPGHVLELAHWPSLYIWSTLIAPWPRPGMAKPSLVAYSSDALGAALRQAVFAARVHHYGEYEAQEFEEMGSVGGWEFQMLDSLFGDPDSTELLTSVAYLRIQLLREDHLGYHAFFDRITGSTGY